MVFALSDAVCVECATSTKKRPRRLRKQPRGHVTRESRSLMHLDLNGLDGIFAVPQHLLASLRTTAVREFDTACDHGTHCDYDVDGIDDGLITDEIRHAIERTRSAVAAIDALDDPAHVPAAIVARLAASTVDWEAGKNTGEVTWPSTQEEADAMISTIDVLRDLIALRDAAQACEVTA